MDSQSYHIPALLPEALNALDIKPEGTYVDATFGGGGHSRAILGCLGERGRLLAFDQDIDAKANALPDSRFTFVYANFRHISNFLRYHGISHADGILADLGVSFHHFDDAARGFSFRADAPLDMRMNQSAPRTAADIIEQYDRQQLIKTLAAFGDLKRPAPIADAIISAREKGPLQTTGQLLEAVARCVNPRQEKKELAQIFQALRIEVNGEMDALEQFLKSTLAALRPGGRLAIITYHSLEDRMVKNFMKSGNIGGEVEKDFFGHVKTPWKQITRSPIVPSEAETARNPRSRSAKLRAAERVQE
jgi:16S rRNA (cytosine1402-N4)-methyltransferase